MVLRNSTANNTAALLTYRGRPVLRNVNLVSRFDVFFVSDLNLLQLFCIPVSRI